MRINSPMIKKLISIIMIMVLVTLSSAQEITLLPSGRIAILNDDGMWLEPGESDPIFDSVKGFLSK